MSTVNQLKCLITWRWGEINGSCITSRTSCAALEYRAHRHSSTRCSVVSITMKIRLLVSRNFRKPSPLISIPHTSQNLKNEIIGVHRRRILQGHSNLKRRRKRRVQVSLTLEETWTCLSLVILTIQPNIIGEALNMMTRTPIEDLTLLTSNHKKKSLWRKRSKKLQKNL